MVGQLLEGDFLGVVLVTLVVGVLGLKMMTVVHWFHKEIELVHMSVELR